MILTMIFMSGCVLFGHEVTPDNAEPIVDAVTGGLSFFGPWGDLAAGTITTAFMGWKWWKNKATLRQVVGTFEQAKKKEKAAGFFTEVDKVMPPAAKKVVNKIRAEI